MKKILIVILLIVTMFSFSVGLTACENKTVDNQNEEQNQEQGETESETDFFVLDSDGNAVATSDTTWLIDEEVKAVKILGDEYTLSGKSEYPIFVESEEVAFMTFKDLKIVSDKGFGFSVWNTNGLIITLEGDNDITVNGYSEYMKEEKQIYGNFGIDMGADLTFVGDGNLNITCGKVRANDEIKKAFNCGIYSTTGNADLSIATSGKISIVIDKAEGTTTTNVLQTGILSDLSVFRMVNGEVEIDIKSSVCSHAEVNVYGVFGNFAFDGGLVSVNVEKSSAYSSGEALALYITNNQSSVDFAVENAESIETDIGYKFAQKTAGEKVVVSFSSEENGVADGETPSDRHGIVVPGPVRIAPVRDELRIKLDPPAIMGVQEDGETVSNIVRAIKEKLCYVAIDPEENGEISTDPKSPLWALLYRDGTNFHIVTMSGGGYVITSADGETPTDVSQRVIIKPIKISSANDSTDGVDGETPTDELVVNLGGSQMRVRIFTPIIPSKNGETADVSGYRFFKVALKKIEGNEDGVTDGEIVTMPEVQTIIFVVVGAEKYADGETPTDAIHAPIFIPRSVEENGTPTEWGEGDVIYLIPLVGGLFSTTITDEEGNVNSLQPRIAVIGKPWYTATGEDDGYFEIWTLDTRVFENTSDGEGAISIIGGGEGGEEQGEAGIKEEVIYIGIIARGESVESVPEQRAVIMSLDDLRPVTMECVSSDTLDNHRLLSIGEFSRLSYAGEAVDAIIGWSASANIIDGSAGGFFRVIVTDSDGVVTGGVEGEGEEWTISNEGETVIIIVPQGAVGFFNSASIESNGESVITGSDFSGNESSQSGGAIYLIGANGEIYVPWRTYTDDQDAGLFYRLLVRPENDGEGAISIIGGEGEETQSEDEKVQVFIKTRMVTGIALQNLSKVTSNDCIKIPTIKSPTKVDDAMWGIYLVELIVPSSGFPDGVEADGEENAKFGEGVTIIIMRNGTSTNRTIPAMRYVLLVGESPTDVDFGGDTIVIVPISPMRIR